MNNKKLVRGIRNISEDIEAVVSQKGLWGAVEIGCRNLVCVKYELSKIRILNKREEGIVISQ